MNYEIEIFNEDIDPLEYILFQEYSTVKTIPQDIIDFNNELNSYEYGILINEKIITDIKDFSKYRTITVDEFKKYKVGVCWDFVNYEAKWFKEHRYKFDTIFIQIDNNNDCPSHTFILFYIGSKVYWFESSWTMYQGIHEYKSKKDAILDIVRKHREFPATRQTINDKDPTYIYEYNTKGLDNHLTAIDFMRKVYKQKEVTNKYIKESNDFIDSIISNENLESLTEAEYNKRVEKLKLEICDVDKFVKVNNCKPITNPVTFIRNNEPSPDGLLSNEIFGITQEQRAGIFAYIDLGDVFLDPSCYKIWSRIDSRVKSIVHGTATFKVNASGELVEDPEGSNGVKFLKDNFDKIKFKRTDSNKRDLKIEYLKKNKNKMFITKYLVIPPYYRDVNTNGKNVGIGYINKLYGNLIRTVNSLQSTSDYGFDNTGAIRGRIQELLLTIYDWFAGNRNASIKEEGVGIAGKKGVIRRANISKTADYASRLVLSAPEMKVETVDDIMVTMEKSALPLSAVIANYYPYIIFYIKKFFENEFGGVSRILLVDKDGNTSYEKAKDPLIEFSDDRIKKELKRFLHGYSNRFIPIPVPIEDSDKVVYLQFKGRSTLNKDIIDNQSETIYKRRLTWCDIFYMAAVESVKNSHILITRYPVNIIVGGFSQ